MVITMVLEASSLHVGRFFNFLESLFPFLVVFGGNLKYSEKDVECKYRNTSHRST